MNNKSFLSLFICLVFLCFFSGQVFAQNFEGFTSDNRPIYSRSDNNGNYSVQVGDGGDGKGIMILGGLTLAGMLSAIANLKK